MKTLPVVLHTVNDQGRMTEEKTQYSRKFILVFKICFVLSVGAANHGVLHIKPESIKDRAISVLFFFLEKTKTSTVKQPWHPAETRLVIKNPTRFIIFHISPWLTTYTTQIAL